MAARPPGWSGLVLSLAFFGLWLFPCLNVSAVDPSVGVAANHSSGFNIRAYAFEGKTELSTNLLLPLLAKYTGTNVTLANLKQAAWALQMEYTRRGYTKMNVVVTPRRFIGGIATLGVFPGPVAQVLVLGDRYLVSSNGLVAVRPSPASSLVPNEAAKTTEPKVAPARAEVAPKTTPTFKVEKYLVAGNTVLPPATIGKVIADVDGAFGTNVTVDGIRAAATALQGAYRSRGYITVAVALPQQKLTNGMVRVKVTEGRLSSIEIKGNHYFSSNNVMRSLPSLHTNMILNGLLFQAELNRANANPDRQIYPLIGPGPEPGTSDFTLKVKDRLPLHAKVELNNQSSPGTPDLRVNTTAMFDNLWQQEHSLGVQYSFSPELYKQGNQWAAYDQPLVANYSGFYRLPLGRPESVADQVAGNPESFGYNEATRKFNLPPASGQADLTFFASRSTIDTGVQNLSSTSIFNNPGVETIVENTVQQDLTVNNDLGVRLATPLLTKDNFQSDFSSGLDFKSYRITSNQTNNFVINEITVNAEGIPNPPIVSTDTHAVPVTDLQLQYLPLNVHGNASLRDALGMNTFSLGLGGNAWYSGSVTNLRNITGSKKSSGYWVVINPGYSRTFEFVTNWATLFRADGQWASEPLISNEQFGAGGVNSVRGYQEGQVFGDCGWHVSLEQQTPPQIVCFIRGNLPLTVRGSIYMDYADTYLLDPQGRPASTALWGTGFGGVASVGSRWEARFLFSLPLLGTFSTRAYDPFFNFSLMAQF
jgi:hemolysin activation/secretion protein